MVENAFGIFAHRWRVFLTTLRLSPKKVTQLILAACCLHNYFVEKQKSTYTAAADVENRDHSISNGPWRGDPCLASLNKFNSDRNPSRNAKTQREYLTTFFNGNGSVPWQDLMIK